MANGKVISQLSVKTKTFNGTTNGNGNLMLPLSASDIVLITTVYEVSNNNIVVGIPYRSTDGTTSLHVCGYSAGTPSVTNTSIAGTIYYL